ncbi:MAG: DUF3307 domain-containing protein [Armatimonadetes bacterium]|nr:DUF3307 domain-containing protein [Armatimonadota bacterium]
MLAHLVADFMLQPYELVELKRRPIGLAIHAGIHAAAMAVLVAGFLSRWWVVVPLVGMVHYFIDRWKVGTGVTQGPMALWLFLLDQAFHLGVLATAVWLAGLPPGREIITGSPRLTGGLFFAVPYVAVTFAGAILQYQVAAAFATRAHPTDLLLWRLRTEGIIMRGVALTIVLFLTPGLWWLGALPFAARLVADGRARGPWVEATTGYGFTMVLGLLFR